MVCVYCNAKYEAPAEYRRHMKEKHRFIRKLAYVHLKSPEAYMKVDCTEMSCSICSRKFDNVRAIAEHLRFAHGKTVTLHEEIAIHPYVFGEKLWACAICPMQLTCLRGLSIHTSTHFNRSTCETCGKSFVNSHSLQRHIAGAHYNEKICEKCKKRFPTNAERHKHLTESPACWRYICRVCGQRCMNQKRKDAHMREVHGQEKTRICTECGLQFTRWELYTHHFITTHTDRAYECTFCGLKLSTKKKFEDHKTVHTKEKPFDCHVCYKAFPTRKTLTQHMWVHSEYKRFECKMCDKKFTQKISWTCHMKSYHPDVNPK
ncbi:zinc finger protein OZF-like [Bombyx mandarina]|nr:zinc finger protein OZF-like [Bombyx mandarina]